MATVVDEIAAAGRARLAQAPTATLQLTAARATATSAVQLRLTVNVHVERSAADVWSVLAGVALGAGLVYAATRQGGRR